jgi:hypothetical protein
MSVRHHSKGVPRISPLHNRSSRLSIIRVSATQVCVSRDRLLISPFLVVAPELYPGIGPQAMHSPELHSPQPRSRVRTLLRKEQPCDDTPAVYSHLEERYEPPPSQLPKKKRRGFRQLVGKFLSLIGLGQEPSRLKKRPFSSL